MHVINLSLGSTRKEYSGLFYELAGAAYFKNIMEKGGLLRSPF